MGFRGKSRGAAPFAIQIFLWVWVAIPAFSHADFLRGFSDRVPAPRPDAGVREIVAPNELDPGHGARLFRDVAPGVFLSVGSERGFISAALSERATHLLLLDYSPSVVKFNRLNIALLQMSESLQDYLYLRFEAKFSDIMEHPGRWKISTSLLSDMNPENWKWWERERTNPAWKAFHDLSSTDFEGANYLRDEKLFKRLRDMARADKIQAELYDLRDVKQTKAIAALLKEAGLRLSVIDISNAWWPNYVGNSLESVLPVLADASTQLTRLVVTDARFVGAGIDSWVYLGFTRASFLGAGGVAQILDWLKGSEDRSLLGWDLQVDPHLSSRKCGSFFR